jgi:hypothetical protein
MLSTLAEFEGEAAVAALRLLALQPDPDLMHAAIEALISRQDAQALRALAVLEPNLPPEAAHAVSRHLHKLRLSGHRARPLQMANGKCRALVGPIDGRGRRLMWFTVPGDSMPDALGYLALLLKDSVGVLDAMGAPAQESDAFPRPAPVGTLHTLETPLPGQSPDLLPHNGTAWCLEAPFDYGLSVLRKGVEENWLSGTPLPLEYQLLFDMVWQYGAGFEEEASFMDRLPDNEEAVENENDLLSDGLFDDWYLESGAVYLAAQELLAEDIGLPIEMTDQSWRALLPMVIKLARSEFGADMRRCYSERLESMAEWLFVAGQEESARLAASAARTMLVSPPEANLFVLTLVQKGLLMALANLMSGSELRI